MADEKQTRREFCGRVAAAAALGSALGAILEGCGGNPATGPSSFNALPLVNATSNGGVTSVPIDPSSPLAAVGGAALVQSATGQFLVAHTAADTFVALGAICTHQRCLISGYAGQSYVCPCHGSQFSFSGQVQGGPAPRALTQVATQFANGVLAING